MTNTDFIKDGCDDLVNCFFQFLNRSKCKQQIHLAIKHFNWFEWQQYINWMKYALQQQINKTHLSRRHTDRCGKSVCLLPELRAIAWVNLINTCNDMRKCCDFQLTIDWFYAHSGALSHFLGTLEAKCENDCRTSIQHSTVTNSFVFLHRLYYYQTWNWVAWLHTPSNIYDRTLIFQCFQSKIGYQIFVRASRSCS